MTELFSARELIEVAVDEERTGVAYYRALAAKTDSFDLRVFAEKMAAMEEAHEARFRKLLERVDAAAVGGPPAGDYMAYMVEGRIFPAGRDGARLASAMASDREAAEMAMELERNTLLFYLEMREFVPQEERALLDDVIAEERLHLTDWARFLQEHS